MKKLSWGYTASISVLLLLILTGTAGGLFAHPAAQEVVTCPGFLPSRLIVGDKGRVSPGSANNLRSEASKSSQNIGQIPGGGEFIVLEGPVCADGLAWWRVDYSGLTGWTAEGSSTDYWLEPAGPPPTQRPTMTLPLFTETPDLNVCPGLGPSYLVVGMQARVRLGASDDLWADLSSGSDLLAEMPSGTTLIVLEGPLCKSDLIWWRVDYNGLTGWTAEGSKDTYWLEPFGPRPTTNLTRTPTLIPIVSFTPTVIPTPSMTFTPAPDLPTAKRFDDLNPVLFAPLPSSLTPFTAANISQLQPLSIIGHHSIQQIAYSADGELVGLLDDLGVWLFAASVLHGNGLLVGNGYSPYIAYLFSISGNHQILAIASHIPDIYNDATDTQIQFVNTQTGKIIGDSFITESINTIALSPDGSWLAVGKGGGEVDLIRRDSHRIQQIRQQGDGNVAVSLAFSPDGSMLAYSLYYGSVVIWNMAANATQISYEAQGKLGNLSFSGDSKLLIAAGDGGSASTPGVLRVWDVATGKRLESPQFEQPFFKLAISPTESIAAFTGDNSNIWVWDYSRGIQKAIFTLPVLVVDLTFTSDGRLAVVYADHTIRLWNIEDGTSEVFLDYSSPINEPQPDIIETVGNSVGDTFSLYKPGLHLFLKGGWPVGAGQLIVVDEFDVDENHSFTFWDLASRSPLARFAFPGEITGLSADGTLLFTTSNGVTWLWGIPQ